MIRVRSNVKGIIVFTVILVSLFVGYKKSNLSMLKKQRAQEEKQDTRLFDNYFDAAANLNKIRISSNCNSVDSLRQNIYGLLQGSRATIRMDARKGADFYLIAEIPDSLASKVVSDFDHLGSGTEISREAIPEPAAEDPQSGLESAYEQKRHFSDSYNNGRITLEQYTTEMEKIDQSIKHWKNYAQEREANRKNHLLYFSSHSTAPVNNDVTSQLLIFVKWTMITALVATVAALILYFFIVGLFKLMSMLGIRTLKPVSRYGYSSGYGYGYGERRKRVYKHKEQDKDERD